MPPPWPSIGLAAALARVAEQEGGLEIAKQLLRDKIENGDIPSCAKNVFRPDIIWQPAIVLVDECPICFGRHRLPVKVAHSVREWIRSPGSSLAPDDWKKAKVAWTEEGLTRRTNTPHPHPDWVDAYGIELHLGKFEKAFPKPETAKSIAKLDRELYPQMTALLAAGKKPHGAADSLVAERKVAGTGTDASKAKRLAKRYEEEVLRSL